MLSALILLGSWLHFASSPRASAVFVAIGVFEVLAITLTKRTAVATAPGVS